jgi:enoyl-CoA hydratase/carnithine racemase
MDETQGLLESEIAENGVWTLTLNRPAQRNALSSTLAHELTSQVKRAGEEARALLLTGHGPVFCAGADLKERAGLTGIQSRAHNRLLFDLCEAVARCPVPVVCALNGPALGGGLELALAADIRVADPTARFALPEVGLGIIPGAGGTERLGRVVGPAWARALLLTGRPVSADEAFGIGLVHEVSRPGECLALGREWADRIAANAPLSVRALKEILRIREEDPLSEGFALERETIFRLFLTKDRDEGLRAFAEKRPPRFEGN